MTEIQSIRSNPVLVGIDIAKNRHEVLIEVPGRKRHRRVTMLNTRADFDRLATSTPAQRPWRDYSKSSRHDATVYFVTTVSYGRARESSHENGGEKVGHGSGGVGPLRAAQ